MFLKILFILFSLPKSYMFIVESWVWLTENLEFHRFQDPQINPKEKLAAQVLPQVSSAKVVRAHTRHVGGQDKMKTALPTSRPHYSL